MSNVNVKVINTFDLFHRIHFFKFATNRMIKSTHVSSSFNIPKIVMSSSYIWIISLCIVSFSTQKSTFICNKSVPHWYFFVFHFISLIQCVFVYDWLHYEWVRDCCLTPNGQCFSCIMARTSYIHRDNDVRFVPDQHASSWIFIVPAHWNNSPRVDMSLHTDTLSWFRVNPSMLFLLNVACLAEKRQSPIL